MEIGSNERGGYKEDDDTVVKLISGTDNRMSDGQGERGKTLLGGGGEAVGNIAITVTPDRNRSVLDSHLGRSTAGRSRSGFPDKSCSLIPPAQSRGHTESEPRGPCCVTCQVSFHSWVHPVLCMYLL